MAPVEEQRVGPYIGADPWVSDRGRILQVQRARLLSAAIETVGELGYAGMTVGEVIGRARMSRKTFYDLFEDREACFVTALDEAIARAARVVVPAYEQEREREGGWIDAIRAGLAALLGFLDAEPGMGRMLILAPLAAGSEALQHRAGCLEVLHRAVDAGRSSNRGRQVPILTAEGVVGAVLSVLHTRVLEDAGRGAADRQRSSCRLIELLGPLMAIVVLPYGGPEAANAELSRRPPRSPRPIAGAQRRVVDRIESPRMRVTYRTLRVLGAIAASPGSSNRAVADAAGVGDQGQISKLLARLEGLGLLEKEGAGAAHGAPNSWHLTRAGERMASLTGAPAPTRGGVRNKTRGA